MLEACVEPNSHIVSDEIGIGSLRRVGKDGANRPVCIYVAIGMTCPGSPCQSGRPNLLLHVRTRHLR